MRINLDPSIAAIIDIDSVGKKEVVNIYFTAEENWTDTYEFAVYNSDKKNSVLQLNSAITILEKVMTLKIDPTGQNIPVQNNYYEIFAVTAKRVVFKGNLNIIL